MWISGRRLKATLLAGAVAAALPASGFGQEDVDALKREVQQLRKEVEELRGAVKGQTEQAATKEEVSAVRKEVADAAKSASEWKDVGSTKHFAGYADVGYTDRRNETGSFSQARFNPAFHYQYRDLVLLDAELEMAIMEDGETETRLEFTTVNLLLHDYAALFAGKLNSAVGQFRQNIHPGWINKLPTPPIGFGEEQAAPTAEVGAGFRGGFPLSDRRMNYAVYVGNGPELELNAAGDEIEMIGTEGFTRDVDGKKVWGGRLGVLPLPRLELGLSAAIGKVAVVTPAGTVEPTRDYDVLGADGSYQWRNLDLRAEYVQQKVGDEVASIAPRGGKWRAWYAQAAYRLAPTKWEGVLRYGDFDTPHPDQDQKQWALGINYVFAPNFLAKAAYEWNDGLAGTPNDADRWLLQLAYGF